MQAQLMSQYKARISYMFVIDIILCFPLIFTVKVPTMQADIESARQLITEDGHVVSKMVQVQERLGPSVSDSRSSLHALKSSGTVKVVKKIIRANKTTAGILGKMYGCL
jgi:hypothetical protein